MSERTPGVYHLLLHVEEPARIRIGRLGVFAFPVGYYVYTGSAMSGLESRIARHHTRRKKLRWHIDYLLRNARVVNVITVPTTERLECARNQSTLALPGVSVVVPRFGASDCRCAAHLVYFGEARPEADTWHGPQDSAFSGTNWLSIPTNAEYVTDA